jgi:hypothetical protein
MTTTIHPALFNLIDDLRTGNEFRFASEWNAFGPTYDTLLMIGPELIYIRTPHQSENAVSFDQWYGVNRADDIGHPTASGLAEWLEDNADLLTTMMTGANKKLNNNSNYIGDWNQAANDAETALFGECEHIVPEIAQCQKADSNWYYEAARSWAEHNPEATEDEIIAEAKTLSDYELVEGANGCPVYVIQSADDYANAIRDQLSN